MIKGLRMLMTRSQVQQMMMTRNRKLMTHLSLKTLLKRRILVMMKISRMTMMKRKTIRRMKRKKIKLKVNLRSQRRAKRMMPSLLRKSLPKRKVLRKRRKMLI